MKKNIKNNIFGFIIGGIIFGSIGVGAATLYYANQISYTPTDTTWNVTDVKGALDDLYELNNKKTGLTAKYLGQVISANGSTTFTIPENVEEVIFSVYHYYTGTISITGGTVSVVQKSIGAMFYSEEIYKVTDFTGSTLTINAAGEANNSGVLVTAIY